MTLDPCINDEVRIRLAKISGKALDSLSQFGLASTMESSFMEYIKVIIKDKLPEMRKWGAFNLPCFYSNFRKTNDDNSAYFDDLYLELCTDKSTSEEVLKCLASGIHEVVKKVSKDKSLGKFKQCIEILMNSEYKSVRNSFSYNLDEVIKYYLKDQDYKAFYE